MGGMPDDGMKAVHKVSCPCGAGVRVDAQTAERSVRCPKCNRLLDFVVSIDARSRRAKVSIVVSMDAMMLEGQSLGLGTSKKKGPPPPVEPPRTRVPPRTVKGVFGTCICGTSFPVDDQELTTIAPCPRCGIEYHVVVKIERGTKKKTAMLVPVKSEVARRPTISPAAPPPPSATRSGKRTQAPMRARTKVAAPKPAPVEIPPGAQAVACSCGETLVVRRKDVVRGMLCPSCGRGLKFKEEIDPQTLAPRISLRD